MVIIACLVVATIIYLWEYNTDKQKLVESYTRGVTPRGNLADFEQTTISIFDTAAPSVVYMYTENTVSDIFGGGELRQGAGSGFLWDREGHIVTNFHVIEGARRIQVRLDNGEAVEATYVGGTPDYDLAVIRLSRNLSGVHPIPVNVSHRLRLWRLSIGRGNDVPSY